MEPNKEFETEKVDVDEVLFTSTDTVPKKKVLNKKLMNFVIGVLIGLLVIGGISTAGITYYSVRKFSQNPTILSLSKFFNYSIAKVNKDRISYFEYNDDLRAMKTFYEKNADQVPALTAENMSDNVIGALVYNRIMAQKAKDMNVSVSEEDIEKVRVQMKENLGDDTAVEEAIKTNYGWTKERFIDRVVVPGLLAQKIAEKIVLEKAQPVLDRIKNGEDFATLAKEFGEDGSKDVGGDLGWFAKGAMVPEFEEPVFATSSVKGMVLPELIKSRYGYHIVKIDDIRTTAKKEKEVKASHILFMVSQDSGEFKKFMDENIKNATLKFYFNIHNPFEKLLNPEVEPTTSTKE